MNILNFSFTKYISYLTSHISFFDIEILKNKLYPSNFDLQMHFVLQPRAIFPDCNFKNYSRAGFFLYDVPF